MKQLIKEMLLLLLETIVTKKIPNDLRVHNRSGL